MKAGTAAASALLGLWGVALVGCGGGPVVAGMTLPPPRTSADAPQLDDERRAAAETEEARALYIAHALSVPRPPPLAGRRRIGSGTGFYIATDKVLTNFHVAGHCNVPTIIDEATGEEVPARLVAGDQERDLAILATDAVVAEPARFETALYTESGERLAIVGYPEHGMVVRQAELSPVSARQAELAADRASYSFNGAVRHGNSGSPVLDDSGAVIGVVDAKIDTVAVYQKTGNIVDNIGIAIANRAVFDFLSKNRIEFLPAAPGASLTVEQLLEKAHGFVRQIGCWK